MSVSLEHMNITFLGDTALQILDLEAVLTLD